MKKIIKKIFIIFVLLLGVSFSSFGQDNIDQFTDWGYKDSDQIKVKEVGPDYIIIESPVIKDAIGENVTTYRIIYSTKPIDAANVDVTDLNDKKVIVEDIQGDTITLKLDGLTPNTTYYIAIEPEDALGEAGAISNQIEVTTKSFENNQTGINNQSEHQVANMEALSNITYNYTGNTITVNWIASQGVEKVQVFISKDNQQNFEKVTEVDASNGKVEISVSDKGLYIIKLIPLDSNGNMLSDGYNLSVKVDNIVTTVKKSPKVGPSFSIVVIALLLFILLYVGYIYYRS